MAMLRYCRQPWIIFLCSVIIGGTIVYSDVSIQKPQDVIAEEGEQITWECRYGATPGDELHEIVWVFSSDVINRTFDAHKHALENGSLYIDAVQGAQDAGSYRCCSKNTTGILCSQEALLQVAELPQFVTHPQPTAAYQGGTARFECVTSGIPKATIAWKHISSNANRSSTRVESNRHIILPNGVLQIHNVSFEDEGQYKCVAANPVQVVRSVLATLTVLPQDLNLVPLSEPTFIHRPAPQRVVAGDDVLLECLVEGAPLIISWSRKDNRPISGPGVSFPGGNNLLIRNTRYKEDNATYKCHATNPETGTTVIAKAKVDVIVPPIITVTPPFLDNVIGSTVRFWCMAVSDHEPVVISWLHNGLPAVIDDYHSHLPSNNDYVVSQMWWEDEGIYQCEAKNAAGSVLASGAVSIITYDEYPGPVRNLTLTALSSYQIQVEWMPPHSPTPIIAYNVEHKAMVEGAEAVDAVEFARSHLLRDLRPYTLYRVMVQCFTARSPCPRTYEYVTTFEAEPSVGPEFSVASETPTSITVSWDAIPPLQANGIILYYGIIYCHGNCEQYNSTVLGGEEREHVIEGLTPNTNYSITMSAATIIGYGEYSEMVVVATPKFINETTPKPPQHLQVSAVNHTSLRVSFQPGPTPPATEGFKLVVTREKRTALDPILLPADSTECVVTDLDSNTVYNIRVSGFNSFGDGRCSTQTTKTPVQPVEVLPDIDWLPPPFEINATGISPSAILIKWEKPRTEKKIIGFFIEYRLSNGNISTSYNMEVNGSTYHLLLRDLEPFTEYEYKIRSIGTSPRQGQFSPPSRATTLEGKPSDPPSEVQASPVNSNTVELTWAPPARPNGIITRYTVMYQRDPGLPEESWECEQKDGSSHHSTIEKLSSDTRYYFKVRAGTQAGDGPPTDAVEAQTLPQKITHVDPSRNMQEGILLGVCLSLVCICICAALITYRFRHVCWRRRAQCRCGGACTRNVHYWADAHSQRIYMSVPRGEEDMNPTLTGLTQYENTPEATPSHLPNGFGPGGNPNHPMPNGHGPPKANGYGLHIGNGVGPPKGNGCPPHMGNGHGPPKGNGCPPHMGNGVGPPKGNGCLPLMGNGVGPPKGNGCPPLMGNGHGPPRANGHGPHPMHPQPGGLGAWREPVEHGGDSEGDIRSPLHHTQEPSSHSMPGHVTLPNSSTSEHELNGTNPVSTLRAQDSPVTAPDMSSSSQDSVSQLPLTNTSTPASIRPPTQGCSYDSGDSIPGAGVNPSAVEGDPTPPGPPANGQSRVTENTQDARQKLPPAHRVDPFRVLTLDPAGIVSHDVEPCPSGVKGHDRAPAQASDPEAGRSGRDDDPTERRTEPNRTVETCKV